MAQKRPSPVIALLLTFFLSVSGWAATSSPTLVVTPPQPKWVELSALQKTILAPLAADWDAMEAYRRKKWIGIAQRFPAISEGEQLRIQGQMQEWTKLTPEQRQLAREKYQTMSQLPNERKQALKQQWEEYSSLPEAEKQRLQQVFNSSAPNKPAPTTALSTSRPSAVLVPSEIPLAPSGTAHTAAEPPVGTIVLPSVAPATSPVDTDPVPRP